MKAKREGKLILSPSKEEAFREEGASLSNHSLQKNVKGRLGWIK